MRHKKSDDKTPLEWVASLAQILDGIDFVDGVSTSQKRAYRKAADDFEQTLKKMLQVELSPPILISMLLGATAELQLTQTINPLTSVMASFVGEVNVTPNVHFMIILGYLCRDILAGERVG